MHKLVNNLRVNERLYAIVVINRREDPLENMLTFHELLEALVAPQGLRIVFLLFRRLRVVKFLLKGRVTKQSVLFF